ncbi:MAG TPA: glycosyltransferase family 2 protein, partial [Candidatus Nitrosotenuis sp.]|nr:glycosyltransferase family 2 protein [Candidatus Nitrosotenuis sp.]
MSQLVSVVIPCYEEAANIPRLYERLARVAEGVDWELEILFVDDGSRDATPRELEKLVQADPRVRAVRLSRNFGSHMACLAGMSYARGEAVAIMAADLQDPPEVLPQLVEKWREGCDVVWAVRHQRRDSPWRLFFSRAYHGLMRRIALAEMPVEGVDFGLFSARVVQAVLGMREKNTSLFGLILWAGYRQTFVRYTKEKRASGRSKWTLGKQVKLLVDSVVSFSFLPIRLISCAGLALAALGLAYAGLIIYVRLFTDLRPETGWPSLIVTVLVLSG